MKKGFTLIELLAVIVILAIIALIATPIVLNIIEDSKESATLRSAEGYLRAVEYEIAQAYVTANRITEGTYNVLPGGDICIDGYSSNTCTGNILEIEYNNEGPISGSITFEKTKIKTYTLTYPSGITVVDGRIGDANINPEDNLPEFAKAIVTKAKDNNYYYETVPDFSKSTEDGEYGLYQTPDDLGTSYYFRGDTEDNYVQFGLGSGEFAEMTYTISSLGYYLDSYSSYDECYEQEIYMIEEAGADCDCFKNGDVWDLIELYDVSGEYVFDSLYECENSDNYLSLKNDLSSVSCVVAEENYIFLENIPMYWRIVRINGDGTIRMIYDGIQKFYNGMIHNASIGEDYWEDGEGSYTGQLGNLGSGTNDSSIKQIIDKWYVDNLKTTYGSYIADSIFCNDREVTSETYYMITEDDWIETDKDTAIEFGDYIVDYHFAAGSRFGKNLAPKLTCTREEDRYTINENLGNGLLSNPIALLTADEAIMAGATKSKSSYYLNTFSDEEYDSDWEKEVFYWTMTPKSYWDIADVFNFGNYLSNTDINANGSEIRPVINLKADVKFTGDGSYDNPYVIVTE